MRLESELYPCSPEMELAGPGRVADAAELDATLNLFECRVVDIDGTSLGSKRVTPAWKGLDRPISEALRFMNVVVAG